MSKNQLWKKPARTVTLAALALTGVLALRATLWRPFDLAGGDRDDGFSRVTGVVHVHTTFSDGGGTPAVVAAAARAAGLAFVAITDHGNVDAKPFESYHDGVLVLVGAELSTSAGHILALGIPDPVFRFSGDARDVLEDVRDLGGLAFAAHPSSPRRDFRWTGWDLPGPWGIELLNGDSEWRLAGWPRLVRTAALYGLNRRYALLGSLNPPDEALAAWDRLLAERDAPGIVGTDAHSRISVTKRWAVRYPSYESLFSLARNHVLLDSPLTGDAALDAARILEALRRGRSYVALDALAPADGFSFTLESPDRHFTMGDTVPLDSNLCLVAGGRLPSGTKLTLLKDGRPVMEREGALELPVPGPGVYRVEARVPGWTIPWVLSNPIYVFGEATRAERAERAKWPREPDPPRAMEMLDTFEGGTVFQTGFDTSSWMRENVLDPTAGADGKGAGRMEFRLGAPSPDHPNTWCAIVSWEWRNLSGRNGLVFSMRGDGVYRVWVQVRDQNPASTDEGTEWWFSSVRTSAAWRRVAIPFATLRSINPRTDGRLDLDKVRAIVFVLDRGAVKVGTRGTIWVDDVGIY